VKWLVVILLGLIAGCLLVELGATVGTASAQVSSGQPTMGITAVAGQITNDSYGIYLIDVENATIAVYQWLPNVRKLRLMAARNYEFDLQLDEFNSDDPSPREIKQLVEQHDRLGGNGK